MTFKEECTRLKVDLDYIAFIVVVRVRKVK